jgi:glycolate oxidase FAD binding subunit
MSIFLPKTSEETAEIVASAAEARTPLAIVGNNSKHAFGRPVEARTALNTSRLCGITLYEPEELVLSARAGTPIAEI